MRSDPAQRLCTAAIDGPRRLHETPMSTPDVQPTGAAGGSRAIRGHRGTFTKRRLGLAYATMIQSSSWNQTSHYDLIRSLNQDKTTIDQYQENTGDKAYYKGH